MKHVHYEAVRNLRGKHSFCPPYWILCCQAPHTTARAQMPVIAMGSLILILGGPFQIRERYLEGHSDKFHESNTKEVAKLKLNSLAGNGIRRS